MRRKQDPETPLVAWQAFAAAGVQGVVQRGERYPADHWLVKRYPEQFLEDGLNLEQRMRERLAESIGAAREGNV